MLVNRSRGQDFVTASDGLPALEVADHAKEKEFVLQRIATIFNNGMHNYWRQRFYVDFFTGPGICRVKESVAEVDGSAILAAKSGVKFTHYFLADQNAEFLSALGQRISGLDLPNTTNVQFYPGEADEVVYQVIGDLPHPRRSLGLAVFDPWGWDFAFESLANTAEGRRLDLVVNFPIGFIKRNWEKELPQLDQFMNGTGYKDRFRAAMRHETPGELPARVLLDTYSQELRKIGYPCIRDHVFVNNSRGLTLYSLIFASRHERGADFWDKAAARTQRGQIRMDLGLE